MNDSVKEFKLPVVSRYYEVKDKLKVIKVKDGVDFKNSQGCSFLFLQMALCRI
ncbi:MAG: hypothetical protein RJR35_04625 [Thermoanaerobacterales bacterium]|nr:hypothetical protein [Thermoanaerobacterales bacterium]